MLTDGVAIARAAWQVNRRSASRLTSFDTRHCLGPNPIAPCPGRCVLTFVGNRRQWISPVIPAILPHGIQSKRAIAVEPVSQRPTNHEIVRLLGQEIRHQCRQALRQLAVPEFIPLQRRRRDHHLVQSQILHGGGPGS